jgi:predicted nucleotidyltransferase
VTITHQSSSAVEEALRETVARFPAVLVAYYFGSGAVGRSGPLSDLDIAILLASSATGQTSGEIEDALCRALRTDRIDLIVLNRAPPPLAYRVVRDGRRIFCRNPAACEAFESHTVMRYLDFKPVRDRAFHVARAHTGEAR